VLLICGGADKMWPSCTHAGLIKQALGRRCEHCLLTEPGAGHFVGTLVPYEPNEITRQLARHPILDEKGRERAWPRVLSFLAANSRAR
jgi:dienelactone hydrolase